MVTSILERAFEARFHSKAGGRAEASAKAVYVRQWEQFQSFNLPVRRYGKFTRKGKPRKRYFALTAEVMTP